MIDFTPDPKPKKPSESARKKREWLRKYGSKERVVFINDLDCATCERPAGDGSAGNPKNQNSHIETGGTGFKSGFQYIIPQCFTCHNAMPEIETFLRNHKLAMDDLRRMARRTELKWRFRLQTKRNHER